jgi:hypothetical protein
VEWHHVEYGFLDDIALAIVYHVAVQLRHNDAHIVQDFWCVGDTHAQCIEHPDELEVESLYALKYTLYFFLVEPIARCLCCECLGEQNSDRVEASPGER